MTTILIVEDNELNIKLFRDLLVNNGYNVITLTEGICAFDISMKRQPDLIISDIQMHDISGYEIVKQLKSNEKTKHIPVIAITALTMPEDIKKINNSGFDDYMHKPICIKDFISTIKEHLNRLK